MSEKVLFELRVSQDESGTHTIVNESEEWKAYKQDRAPFSPCPPLPRLMGKLIRHRIRRAEDDLRDAVDSLQAIYDDLYGRAPAEDEASAS